MTEPYTIEEYSNRQNWLRARKSGIGSSDSACVVGMGRWRGAYSVATDKLTEAIDESAPDEMQEAGHLHEPTIAKWFAEMMEKRGWK